MSIGKAEAQRDTSVKISRGNAIAKKADNEAKILLHNQMRFVRDTQEPNAQEYGLRDTYHSSRKALKDIPLRPPLESKGRYRHAASNGAKVEHAKC